MPPQLSESVFNPGGKKKKHQQSACGAKQPEVKRFCSSGVHQLPESKLEYGQATEQQAAPVNPRQQLPAPQQAIHGDGQADAQAVGDQAAATMTAQLQASVVAEQPQKRKKAIYATADRQHRACKIAVAEDSRKKKKKKQRKQHSDDAAKAATKCADPSATHAALQETRQAGVQAAAQDAVQAFAEPHAVGGTLDAGTLKSGAAAPAEVCTVGAAAPSYAKEASVAGTCSQAAAAAAAALADSGFDALVKSGAHHEDQKKLKGKPSCTGGAAEIENVACVSSADTNLGDMKASNAANDPDGAKTAGKQLESSAPSKANGPGGEPAAHTSLPAGDAAAEDAQADALPISTEIEANQKNKKKQKQKKRQQESNGFAAASQPPSNDQSQLPVKPRKKKHKSGKCAVPGQGVAAGAGPVPAPAAAPAPTPATAPGPTNGADTGQAAQETSGAQAGSPTASPAEGVQAQHINQQKTPPRPQSAAIAAPFHPFPTQFKSNTGRVHMAVPVSGMTPARRERNGNKHKRLFLGGPGGLTDGEPVEYRTAQQGALLQGTVCIKPGLDAPAGILCQCCQQVVSCSKFEAHAGQGHRRAPYDNIFTAEGITLRAQAAKLLEGVVGAISGRGPQRLSHSRSKGNAVHHTGQLGRTVDRDVDFDPDHDAGECNICGRPDFALGAFCDRTMILCDQCECEFHVGCLRKASRCNLSQLPTGNWFCSEDCSSIWQALNGRVAAGPSLLESPDYSLQLMRGHDTSGTAAAETTNNAINIAQQVLQESFDPIIDKATKENLLLLMTKADVKGEHDYRGMYTALLTHQGRGVCAAVFRAFGAQLAEVPLVATKDGVRRQGHFRILINALESLLREAGVQAMCLPAAHSTVHTWVQGFDLQPMPDQDLDAACKHLRLLIFPGTKVLHKQLLPALAPMQGPLMTPPWIEEPAGPLAHGQIAVQTSSDAQQVVNAEAATSSFPILEPRAEASAAATIKAACNNVILLGQTQSEADPMPPSATPAAAVGAAHDTPMTEHRSATNHEAHPKVKRKKERKKKQKSHVRKASKGKPVTVLTSIEAIPGDDSAHCSKAKPVAEQLESSDAKRTPAAAAVHQPAARTSLSNRNTAVRHAEADALPTGREQKKKRKRETPAAARHVEPASDPLSSAKPAGTVDNKKKRSKGVPADPKHGQDLGDPKTAVGQASSIPLGQAGGGPAEGQAGPIATAVNREKAEQTKEDIHTGKSGGGGAAAAEAGKGKVEKSKSHKAAQAQLGLSDKCVWERDGSGKHEVQQQLDEDLPAADMHEQQQSQQKQLKQNAESKKSLWQASEQPLQQQPLLEENQDVDREEKKKPRQEKPGNKQRKKESQNLQATEEQLEPPPRTEQLLEDGKQQQLEQQEDQQHDTEEHSCPPRQDPGPAVLEQRNRLQDRQQQQHQLHQLPSAQKPSAQAHDAVTHRRGAKLRPSLVGDVLCKDTAVYCIAEKLPGCPVYGRIMQDVPLEQLQASKGLLIKVEGIDPSWHTHRSSLPLFAASMQLMIGLHKGLRYFHQVQTLKAGEQVWWPLAAIHAEHPQHPQWTMQQCLSQPATSAQACDQAGCSQPDEAYECCCETAVHLKASQAQHANTTLPTCTTLPKLDSAHTLSAPDEAMDLSSLQNQAQAVARAELLPAFIHQSLLQCARGNKLPANTPLYGLFRMLQEGQMLMVYGTNLLNIQMDEVKGGEEAIALDVEGYSVHTPEPPADWLVALPLLGLPGSGEPLPKKGEPLSCPVAGLYAQNPERPCQMVEAALLAHGFAAQSHSTQAAKATPPAASPLPKPAKLANPAEAGQTCQLMKQCTPATALPPFHQAHLGTCLPSSPASPDASHSTLEPRGTEPPLEANVPLHDADVFGNVGVEVQLAEADREPPFPADCPVPCRVGDIVENAVLHVMAWQHQNQKKLWGREGSYAARQYLSPQSAHVAALLSEVEAQQRFGLKHCPPHYCQFLTMREYWYRLLGEQAVQLHQHATYLQVAALATGLVLQWIRNIQQTLGVLLPADNGGHPRQQAHVHSSVLPEPSLSAAATAATQHGSQATTGSRHEDLALAAQVTPADQQPDIDKQVRQAGCDPDPEPDPSATCNAANRSYHLAPVLETKQSEGSIAWVSESPLPECECGSCLAWLTCKQLPMARQARDGRPYRSLPGPKRLFSRQEQKDQFKLEDTVLNHNEDRMELYKRGSQSAQVRLAKYEGLYANTGGNPLKQVPRREFLRLVPTLLYACTEGPMPDTPASYRAIQDLAVARTSAVAGQPAVALNSLPLRVTQEDISALISGEVNASGMNMYMGLLQERSNLMRDSDLCPRCNFFPAESMENLLRRNQSQQAELSDPPADLHIDQEATKAAAETAALVGEPEAGTAIAEVSAAAQHDAAEAPTFANGPTTNTVAQAAAAAAAYALAHHSAQPGKKRNRSESKSGAELANKKQKKRGKEVSDRKVSRSKILTDADGAEAHLRDGRAAVADESSAHLEGSVPAEPTEPSFEPTPDLAAHTSLPAGGAADRGAEADDLLGSREVTKKKKQASDSQVVASLDLANDLYSDYVTVSSEDVEKFQTQGYMSCNLIGDNCPLDCDMLVFPVPIGKQWACAVVDMRELSITYGSSSKGGQVGQAAVFEAVMTFLEQQWQIWCSADLPVFKQRVPKYTAMHKDIQGDDSGVFALTYAEHASRYVKPPAFNQTHIDMWKTKITVDLALKHVPTLYRQPT